VSLKTLTHAYRGDNDVGVGGLGADGACVRVRK
jgi:hypothetical protein